MPTITLGLSQINVAEGRRDGTKPAAGELKKIGKTYKNTCKISQEKSEKTEHYEEGRIAPEVSKKTKKMPTLAFSIMDPDLTFLKDYLGGEITGEGDDEEWGFEGTEIVENRYVEVIPEQGLIFTIPNGDIEATVNGDMSSQGIFLVDFVVTPQAVDVGKPIRAKKKK